MNKKGIFALLLFLLTIVLLSYATFLFFTQDINPETSLVGNRSVQLFNSYNKGEAVFLYFERAAEYAIFDSISEIVKNAGTNSECGVYKDVVYLESASERCYFDREGIENNFEEEFNKKLKNYMKDYPEVNFFEYGLEFGGNLDVKTVGEFILEEQGIVNVVNSNSTFNVDFDFDGFVGLLEDIKEFRAQCDDLICWESKTKNYNGYMFHIKEDNKVFIFEVVSDSKLKNFYGEKEVIISFAIDNSRGIKKDV